MAISERHFQGLLDAAHAFFDAADRDSLIETIKLHTTTLLGCLDARAVLSESRAAVDDSLAEHLGIAPLEPHPHDQLRQRLEPFYNLTGVIDDTDPELGAAVRDFTGEAMRSIAVALRAGATFYGILIASDQEGERVFDDADRAALLEIAAFAGQAIRTEEIAQDREARDGLTGLFDQRYLRRHLRSEIDHDQPVAIVMLDVDHFKRVNDTAGHAAGDQVLRLVAAHLQARVRTGDLPIRYGGEEFAIMLPGADETAAYAIAERLREQISSTPEGSWSPWPETVTASLGVAARRPGDTIDADTLIDQADQALYAAKRSGRNRVVRASSASRTG